MHNPIAVLILAAGQGTRMKSRQAKVLHRAGGLTLIEHVAATALEMAPAPGVLAVIGHQAEQVRAAAAPLGIRFVVQQEQRGTGHAVLAAQEALAGHRGLLLVLYGDCPLLASSTLARLVETHRAGDAAATVITTTIADPAGYGRVVTDGEGAILAIVEEKAADAGQRGIREINSGIYCFDTDQLWPRLETLRPNSASGEYYLTDVVELLRAAGRKVRAFPLADASEVLGINTRAELAAADRIFRERKVAQLMSDGVTVERPETVTVDVRVSIGMDTVVEPFARLLGRTAIGEDCRIGASAIIEDSTLGDRVVVGPFTIIGDSRIADDARVGPFARLRFGNDVEAGAHIGNFVELKKTRMGAGAKAQHLAYLGDSVIGGQANIGAGTITCNYDGERKHVTEIGPRAFVGSNATLVAPVTIGAASYIAAGSVITDEVPQDALALGRARQVVKPAWARRRRAQSGSGEES